METINDIIAELRNSSNDDTCPWWADGGSCDHCPLGKMGTNCPFRKFADRIEQAVTDCNQFKMREALEQARRVLHCAIVADILKGKDAHEALNVVTAALCEPPRNCDLYTSLDDAWNAFCKINPPVYMHSPWLDSLVKFRDWLYDEAKGQNR